MNHAVSKRIFVTLPDVIHKDLEEWAEYQGRPTANLAAYLIESGIRAARAGGEFKTLDSNEQPTASDRG